MNLGAVILAAGYSSRMAGGFKPLMRLGEKTLLAHCATLFARAGITDILVITGHRHREVKAEADDLGLYSLVNPDYDSGMFSSIQRAVGRCGHLDGFFLLPVDIPLIYPATVRRLIDHFDRNSVIIPVFNGRRGHPPLIPAAFIPAIRNHDGQGGLRSLLAGVGRTKIAVWDRGILMDGDTPDDFQLLVRRHSGLGVGEPDEALALAALAMPSRGVAHGRTVAETALRLGQRLNERGADLDLTLIHNSALLHDLAKGGPEHEANGARQLERLGLYRLAPIVGAHRALPPPADGQLSEREIVCLADKLCRGDRQVTVYQRFGEKLYRYRSDRKARAAIGRRLQQTLALLKMVQTQLGCTIAELLDMPRS